MKAKTKNIHAVKEEIVMDVVIEAIGSASEVITDEEPSRSDLIKLMRRSGKPIARIKTSGDLPDYMTFDEKLLRAGYEVGTSFRLVFKPMKKPTGTPPIITSEEVEAAIREADSERPTQKSIAESLQVSERTLERWRAREGMKTWKEALDRVTQ
jgi:hypothetical protein